MIRLTTLAALIVAGAMTLAPAWAQQTPPPDPKPADAKPAEAKKDDKQAEAAKEEQKKIDDYEKAIKDLPRIEGAFTFYQKKKELLLELPEEAFDKLFLIQPTMGSGLGPMLQAGDPLEWITLSPFKWQKNEDSVWLVRPNTRYRWDDKDPLALSASRSYPEAYLSQFKIEQTHPKKKLSLINVTNLFYGDLFRLSENIGLALGGQYGLDREKSGPARVKSFPENAVVEMKLHYFSPRGAEGNPLLEMLGLSMLNQLEDSRSAPVRVTYNLWYRKDSGYMPRLADPRVGYFTQDAFSFDRFDEQDRINRFAMRFNLKKKDPTAKLSEPVKPVVWTLDPSIPEKYRAAVGKGVLNWNKAFEQIGYKDAVRVQEAPNDPDYDHADGRFNVIRWTMSDDSAYAVAQFRGDPFTGEILNAAITLDANMAAYAGMEYARFSTPSANAAARALEVLLADPRREGTDDFYLWATDKERAAAALARQMPASWHRFRCDLPYGLAQSAAQAMNLARATGLRLDKEAYVESFLTETVTHEVGHCFGLRHNFVASTSLTTEELGNDKVTSERGITASVMDYVPVNVMAVLNRGQNFYTPTIGAYDKWAIRYGYADTNANTPEGERAMLANIASESGKDGHAFMTDENADFWDPYVVRFDNGRNPLEYSAAMLKAARRIREYAIKNLPRAGQDYSQRTEMVLSSILSTFREGRLSARFVGGLSASRTFRADGKERRTLKPVDPEQQRRAVRLIASNCLVADAFALPESVLQSMSLNPSQPDTAFWTAPLRSIIGTQQMMLVSQLLAASTTNRIAENEYKAGKGAYTLDEHYSTLLGAVFSEIGQNRSVAPLRRDLQRFTLHALITQAGAPPLGVNEDVRMLASDSLRQLSNRLGGQAARPQGLDGMTVIHLREAKQSIDRFMDRSVAVSR